MNAAFEDCLILYKSIKSRLDGIDESLSSTAIWRSTVKLALNQSVEEFAKRRVSSVNSLADLCLEHYKDMASNTSSSFYLLKKKVESAIGELFPSVFRPLYSMVAFSDTPYDEAIRIAGRQNTYLNNALVASSILGSVGLFAVGYYYRQKK
jgi:kynurenine 3-monooxygenase